MRSVVLHPAVIKFLAKAGAKGGAKKGPTKKRGDAEYYRRIRLSQFTKEWLAAHPKEDAALHFKSRPIQKKSP